MTARGFLLPIAVPLLALPLAGCPKGPQAAGTGMTATASVAPSPAATASLSVDALVGTIENSVALSFDMRPYARVDLIDPTSFAVLATTVADALGDFVLAPPAGWTPAGPVLLRSTQFPFGVSSLVQRIDEKSLLFSYQTAIAWTGSTWTSIATNSAGIIISLPTTVVTNIGLNNPAVGLMATMGTVQDDVPATVGIRSPGYVANEITATTQMIQAGYDPVAYLNSDASISVFCGPPQGNQGINYQEALSDPTQARFNGPLIMGIDAQNDIYVDDIGNGKLRVVHPDGTTAYLAGDGQNGPDVDGPVGTAQFNQPEGAAVLNGLIYVSDSQNDCIRVISGSNVTTLCGQPGTPGFANGLGGTAQFNYPRGIAAGPDGNLYVADWGNACIRKVTPQGIVSTFAGIPQQGGYQDGPAVAAQFSCPYLLTFDPHGNLLVADYCNRRIRSISPAGVVSTVAGTTYGKVDGPAASAEFIALDGLAVDPSGAHIYVHDDWSQLRVVENGMVRTIGGYLPNSYFPQPYSNGPWTLYPSIPAPFVGLGWVNWRRLVCDSHGYLYMFDRDEQRLLRVDPS